MEFNSQQIAHIVAALRYTQASQHDISDMEHFADDKPLTNEEVDNLCEAILCDPSGTDYAVVGLYPDHMWDSSMRDSTFVFWVSANGPIEAVHNARLQVAQNHVVDEMEGEEIVREMNEFADSVAIIAVMPGHLHDLYDPKDDKEKGYE